MPQPAPFQFKQFSVNQHEDVFKVGTDGVLLGSWAKADGCSSVLEVGSGTGLVSLMLAQRHGDAQVIAIDINERAVELSDQNFKASPWSKQLTAQLRDFSMINIGEFPPFDLIVSNPPFFAGSLPNKNQTKSMARHEGSLNLGGFLTTAAALSSTSGRFSLILPMARRIEFERLLKESIWHEHEVCFIKPTANKPFNRFLTQCVKTPTQPKVDELELYQDHRVYSVKARYWLQNFLINL